MQVAETNKANGTVTTARRCGFIVNTANQSHWSEDCLVMGHVKRRNMGDAYRHDLV